MRGAVDGGDDKWPGYRTTSYRATAVPGATAGHEAVVPLGAEALGASMLWAVALQVATLATHSCGEREGEGIWV